MEESHSAVAPQRVTAHRKVSLVSYSSGKFIPFHAELNTSARRWGISRIFNYGREDLEKTNYYQVNRAILDEPCGGGYWAWKPFFILEALSQLEDGDILFYVDAASLFVADPAPLIELAATQPDGLVLFDARPLTNRQFTKRDCFVRLGCDSREFWDAKKVIATLMVIRNCETARAFLSMWLKFCQDRVAISNDPSSNRELRGFIQHRSDQSILSVLAAQHRLETFRNPTLWGNFLKMPAHRIPGEQVVSPYGLPLGIKGYSTQPQTNSDYGTLFLINRLPNMEHKKPFFRPTVKDRVKKGIKSVLRSLGLPTRRSSFANRFRRS
jgi:hypothetical protein